jgi:hypothetical protein
MTRLASTAKAGYYPSPDRVTETLKRFVLPSTTKTRARLLDPCCGYGYAAKALADAWNLASYGIEIDAQRSLEAKGLLDNVLHLDYAKVRAPHDSYQILYENPPYDYSDLEGKRTELVFLRDCLKWLQPAGVFFFVIPQYRLDPRMAGYLAAGFDRLQLFRFPDPEYDNFRQMVVMGVRRAKAVRNDPLALELVQRCRGELPILPEAPTADQQYAVPEPVALKLGFFFRGDKINADELLAEAMLSGAWHSAQWEKAITPVGALTMHPVMPIKRGHLGQMIACGLMQNILLERPADPSAGDAGERLLVKGRTYKTIEKIQTDKEEIERDKFVTEIHVLNLDTGEAESLSDVAKLSAFIEQWRDALATKVMDQFVPNYAFDLDAEGPGVARALNRLSQHTLLPGMTEPGLFPAQRHVAVALAKLLTKAKPKPFRYAICLGEPGVGKTRMSCAVAELVKYYQGGRLKPVAVLCPPHLVAKWVREIQETIPMAIASTLDRISDVDAFFEMAARANPGTPIFAVLSREMAKLGGGWRPAYIARNVAEKDGRGRIERTRRFFCPKCGGEIVEEHGWIVREVGYFS